MNTKGSGTLVFILQIRQQHDLLFASSAMFAVWIVSN
jgi:hypothetical protein